MQRRDRKRQARLRLPVPPLVLRPRGNLRGVLRADLVGQIDKSENSLLKCPSTPSPDSSSSTRTPTPHHWPSSWAPRCAELLAPYHLDEMVTVLDVREPSTATGKSSSTRSRRATTSRHPPGAAQVIVIDPTTARSASSMTTGRRRPVRGDGRQPGEEVEGIMDLPETFPSTVGGTSRASRNWSTNTATRTAARIPRRRNRPHAPPASDARHPHRDGVRRQRSDRHPDDRQPRLAAVPELLHDHPCRRSHVITSVPHPDGDPNRCIWHIRSYM